ncbi:hypothetical protein A3B02_02375 [Candidatus Roizmanbacteria bacterium RIFCSPLOWO2_01_FULL_42_14]|uniref:HMA domain-containing protein n=2 Tax=Candidatus Roizmaniibacteriota TaxID=1752723 RepID=A0A1F7JXA2_9BACT|nr:MAG: hypothetical protein A3B02_02375 [Candidatus Roizmanbacteria bacterium RIFCSPLOWO2_01_FULL_42_14]OGK60217.1 MAG: hypothetical protein A3I56_00115 [Candidatus Roizmanbacteria bacterium RIFCSPLOWO2_02_FULL_43_10]
MKTVTFDICGMHCTSCALNIDGELEDTEGVIEARTSYARQQTRVTFNPETISVDKIVTTINSLDERYNAVPV